MPTRQLYALSFFEDDLQTESTASNRRQSLQGVLQQSVPQVRTIAAEPGSRDLRGSFVGQFADIMAAEIQELLQASDVIGEVPYFVQGENRDWQGYYAPQAQREGDRRDPRLSGVHTFDGTLSAVGSRRSHVRSLKVTPTPETNPFGSATTEQVWLHGRASDPRWVNETTDTVEAATVQASQPAEHSIDVDRFDVTEPSFASDDAYWLVYDLAYEREWEADPRVWDTHGNAKEVLSSYSGDTVGTDTHVGTATVGDERRVSPAWQRVYLSQHDYVGERVIENGRLRLEPRPDDEVLRAYRWDSSDDVYGIVQLGNTAWRCIDWDVRRIGLERVESLTRWEDTDNRGTTFELVCDLPRGFENAVFYEPQNASGSTPADLVTRLDPIAHGSDTVMGEAASVMERSEVPNE